MEWIKAENQMPNDGEQVLVWNFGHKLLVWNDTYKCWDDEEGDDYFCDEEQIEYWIRLPENPYDRNAKEFS